METSGLSAAARQCPRASWLSRGKFGGDSLHYLVDAEGQFQGSNFLSLELSEQCHLELGSAGGSLPLEGLFGALVLGTISEGPAWSPLLSALPVIL